MMLSGEIPESRPDIEASLVGCLLFDGPGDADRREQLFAQFSGCELSSPELRKAFSVFRRMHLTGVPMGDPVVAFNELVQDGFSAADATVLIARCAEKVPYAYHIAHYASILRGFYKRDELRTVGLRLAEESRDKTVEPDSIVHDVMQQLESIRGAGAGTTLIDADTALRAFDERRKSDASIRTGLVELDRLLNGGFRPGQLVIIGGRPSTGKSALMQQLVMKSATAGAGGLYVSAEMSVGELAERGLKSLGRENFRNLPIWFSETSDLSRLVSESRMAVRRHGVQLIVVDYLQLFRNGPRGRNTMREQEVAELSRSLKCLAHEMGVVVVAGSQLNRAAVERDRPSLSDLRESGAIEQDADVVFLLSAKDEDGSGIKPVELLVAKHRNGCCGRLELQFNGREFRFSESSGPDTEALDWAAMNSFSGIGQR